MIINKKVIILRCKSELPLCNLLELIIEVMGFNM